MSFEDSSSSDTRNIHNYSSIQPATTTHLPVEEVWLKPIVDGASLYLSVRIMVDLYGGYKLTMDQTLMWCHEHDLFPPEGNIALYVNRWLRARTIGISLLPCTYQEETIFLIVTQRHLNAKGTLTQFKPFQEDQNARNIKDRMKRFIDIANVEFVTVADPYG